VDLASMHCRPRGLPRLNEAALEDGLRQLAGWTRAEDGQRLRRTFRFRDFKAAMAFVDAMAALAEREGHHPDFSVSWNTVEVTLWIYDAAALTENDLVLAARVSALPEASGPG